MTTSKMTITEGLAEIKTIDKRLEKKRQFVGDHLLRQGALVDPLESSGGQRAAIAEERQSISDLETRKLTIRSAISRVNMATPLTVGGMTMTIAEWIIWRRDVAGGVGQFLSVMRDNINRIRLDVAKKGFTLVAGETRAPNEITVNIDEKELAADIENHEKILGQLDGQLSLLNATTMIEV